LRIMTTKSQILKFLTNNRKYLRDNFHVIKIGIFGSFARGDQDVGSDIDFVVEFEKDTQNLFETKQNLREFLRSEFKTEVDICREKYIKPKLRKSILKETIYA
jgi:predicted nucleotidyltransferase